MAMATRGRIACEGAVSFVLLCLTVVCSFDDTTCLLASTAFGIILVSYRDTPQIYLYLNINQTDCCFFSLQVSKTD
jgi:hypothetical protein